MRKLKFDDPDELKTKIGQYFETYGRLDPKGDMKPPTLSGLALHLGTTRHLLNEYINAALKEDAKGRKAECGELLVMAKARIECFLEEMLISDYSKGLEFVLKNGYKDWGDKTTVTVDGGMDVKHEGEISIAKLTDEELLARIGVLQAKAGEIMRKEGTEGGTVGQ